jgi:uncharacterized repeat protein (TIGR01451 family)
VRPTTWLSGFLLVLALGGFFGPPASAEHVPAATYSGTHSGGGVVEVTVSNDGSSVTSFSYTALPIGCGTSLSGRWTGVTPILADRFSFPAQREGDVAFSGTFTDAQTVTGTATWRGPFCQDGRPVVTWNATTSSPPLADLAVTLADSADPVLLGDRLAYTATVRNSGPMSAPAAALTQTLPTPTRLESVTPSQGTCAESPGVVTCELGTLAVGGSATVEVVVTPARELELTSSVTVSGTRQDPERANDSATERTAVEAPCLVPNVKGRSLATARRAITGANCRTRRVTHRFSRSIKTGRVISQAPRPRTRGPKLAAVDLVVSRGPKPKARRR